MVGQPRGATTDAAEIARREHHVNPPPSSPRIDEPRRHQARHHRPDTIDEPAAIEPDTIDEPAAVAESIDEPAAALEQATTEPETVEEPEATTEPETVEEPEATSEPETVEESDTAVESEPDDAEALGESDTIVDKASDVEGQSEAEPMAEIADDSEAAAEPEAEAVPALPTPAAEVVAGGTLPAETVALFRERMAMAHDQFTSSPAAAVAQAELVVTEAVVALHRSLLDGAANLGAWQRSADADLADAMRNCRNYLDRILAL
jgi:hypothetical protein